MVIYPESVFLRGGLLHTHMCGAGVEVPQPPWFIHPLLRSPHPSPGARIPLEASTTASDKLAGILGSVRYQRYMVLRTCDG